MCARRFYLFLGAMVVALFTIFMFAARTGKTSDNVFPSSHQGTQSDRTTAAQPSGAAAKSSQPTDLSDPMIGKQPGISGGQSLAANVSVPYIPPAVDPALDASGDRVYYSAEEVLNLLKGRLGPGFTFYATYGGDYALAVSGKFHILTTIDGKLIPLSAVTSGEKLELSCGTLCALVAEKNGFYLGMLNANAFVLVTPSGEEITFGTPQHLDNPQNVFACAPEAKTTLEILSQIKSETAPDHTLFASADKTYAMLVAGPHHTLILPTGRVLEFDANDNLGKVETPSGTIANTIAAGDGRIVVKNTDDSYTIIGSDQTEAPMERIASSSEYGAPEADEETGELKLPYTGSPAKPDWSMSMADARLARQFRHGLQPNDYASP